MGRGKGNGQQEQGAAEGQKKQEPRKAEWVVGIASALVVVAALGYLFYQALSGPSQPPMVTTRVERIVPMRQGYLVEFVADNGGNATAANLMVEGALMQESVAIEKSTATLDFVPAETERRGGLFFARDPRRYRLEVRPTGYDLP